MKYIRTDPVKRAIELSDEERSVTNAKCNAEKFAKYSEAIAIAQELFSGGRGNVDYDSPQLKYSYHGIVIKLYKNDFEDNDVKIFAKIISASDSIEIDCDCDDNIIIVLIFENIYT